MTVITSQGYETKKLYDERYLKYGFDSIELMNAFQSNGYESMSDYEIVKSRTPKWFINNCKGSDHYINDCFGKRIIWYGIVSNIGSNAANIDVRGDKGAKIDTSNPFSLRIDSKSLKHHGVKKGQLIEFHGRIDEENFVTPDIESVTFVRFESEEDQKIRDKRVADKIARKNKKEKQYFEKNKYNAKWLMNKYGISAGMTCSRKIPKLAKYDHKWTDEMFEAKFSHYKSDISSPGVLTVLGDKIKFQNGFGAWMKMEYWCKYDTQNRVVIDYGLQ